MGYFGGGGGGGSFSGGTLTATTTFNDDIQARFGTSGDAALEYDTTQNVDTLMLGVSADSRAVVIAEKADIDAGFNFAHALQTNPTLFIHSANQATNEWISFSHDGTYANVTNGFSGFPVHFSTGLRIATNTALEVGVGEGGIQLGAAQTPDTMVIFTGPSSNHVVMGSRAQSGFDFAHAATTNPTFFIHSNNGSTTQWVSLSHNQTDALINAGTGRIHLSPAFYVGNGSTNIISNDANLLFADAGDQHGIRYSTAQTPDTLQIAVGTTARSILVCERGDQDFDFAVAQQTNPTIVVTSSNQSTNERIGIRHNQTQGQIVDLANTASSARPIGLQGGAAVASAATITPTGNVFHVTGTTTITSVTAMASGTVITIIFDGALTFTDGSNLVLAGNFSTAANATITLACDGTNWYECHRSTN